MPYINQKYEKINGRVHSEYLGNPIFNYICYSHRQPGIPLYRIPKIRTARVALYAYITLFCKWIIWRKLHKALAVRVSLTLE